MASKSNPVDPVALVDLIDSASGRFSCAEQGFGDLATLLKAIIVAVPSDSPAGRLADLGLRLALNFEADFEVDKDHFNEHASSYGKSIRFIRKASGIEANHA